MNPVFWKFIGAAIFGVSAYFIFHYAHQYIEWVFIGIAALCGYFIFKNNPLWNKF